LSELLGGLSQVSALVQMRGIDTFIESVEAAIAAGQGTREMQGLVSSYRTYVATHSRERDILDTASN